jgi:site-specific DNA recombinase
VLTVAYCRVSTEEQADEGYSIEGQTDKLRLYASLHSLGEVTIIADPGASGKNLKRAGVQQVILAIEAGHVSNLIVWRLDRLSRSLKDLILLADLCGQHNVALHSVTDNLDLSSASGRMFYNILGSFAQYYREQLSENVKMGNERAVKEGKWINRPKTGYNLVNGELVPNADASRVQEIFRLRASNASYRAIEERTGIKYSTVCAILNSKIYLGEILHNGQWSPGRHEAIITSQEWHAAHRHAGKGVRPSKDILTGRVKCGICARRMVVQQNGRGSVVFKCRHRGQGCDQPARSNKGLARSVVFGLSLLKHDERLIGAIRRKLAGGTRPAPGGGRRDRRPTPAKALESLSVRRRQLLDLYYAGSISAEGFKDEEERLLASIESARAQVLKETEEKASQDDFEARFAEVAAILQDLDIEKVWATATVDEQRVLVEELVEAITVFPDHLEVKVNGVPSLNILYGEVGLKVSEIVGVGDGT